MLPGVGHTPQVEAPEVVVERDPRARGLSRPLSSGSTSSAISRASGSDEVAAGEGALRT